MQVSTLLEVKAEMKRFEIRINAAITRLRGDEANGDYPYGSKETAAVKRAAIDLKNELTKITK